MPSPRTHSTSVRQVNGKGCATTFVSTGPDVSSVSLHDAAHDGEPHSRAAHPRIAARSPESVENVRYVPLRNSRPGVRDADPHPFAVGRSAHADHATSRRKLQRVPD